MVINMDNYNSTGNGSSEDMFGFIPPNMMYPQESNRYAGFSSREEMERYFYHLEHDNEFHISGASEETDYKNAYKNE